MEEKKRKSARALRDRKRILSRYYHSHDSWRSRSEFAHQQFLGALRLRVIFAVCAVFILGIGLFYVIF